MEGSRPPPPVRHPPGPGSPRASAHGRLGPRLASWWRWPASRRRPPLIAAGTYVHARALLVLSALRAVRVRSNILSRLDNLPGCSSAQAGEICCVGCVQRIGGLLISSLATVVVRINLPRGMFFFSFQIVGSRHVNVFSEMDATRSFLAGTIPFRKCRTPYNIGGCNVV